MAKKLRRQTKIVLFGMHIIMAPNESATAL